MEPSPHRLPEEEGSVIPGSCKSPVPSGQGAGRIPPIDVPSGNVLYNKAVQNAT